ncbi:MAG: ComEC/Rec2 family competence protein [Patescibacteria group bacterium]|nr:ComEC/Rec2 family competence protein [Patescibacteria group bacterium]MDE2438655.1 ComEC/Rec2 family competence protein [Patescibacteria group bacterium]
MRRGIQEAIDAILVGIIAGGLAAPFLSTSVTWYVCAGVAVTDLISIAAFRKAISLRAMQTFVALQVVCAMVLYAHFFVAAQQAWVMRMWQPRGTVALEGVVASPPESTDKVTRFLIAVSSPHVTRVSVVGDIHTLADIRYGDVVGVAGVAETPQAYTAAKDPTLRAEFAFPRVSLLHHADSFSYYARLLELKTVFAHNIQRSIPDPYASFGISLLMGKSGIPAELSQAMRLTGTTHLVALSGFNISVMSVYLFSFLLWLRIHRKIALLLSGIIIIVFVIMMGAEASLVRAAVMGELVIVAGLLGRPYSFWRAVLCAACGMVVLNPVILINDVGFQLSFLATLGLALLLPIFDTRFGGGETVFDWKMNFFATCASQIMVFPILINTFGIFSPLSLVTNVLILSVIPATMLVVFMVGLCGFVSSMFAAAIGLIASLLLGYEIGVIRLFSTIPLTLTFSAGFMAPLFFVVYYIGLALLISRFWNVRYTIDTYHVSSTE